MLPRLLTSFLKNNLWSKITTLGLTLFFIFLADAILSFLAPNLIQDTFKSSLMMGLIMSFSSVAGIMADALLPQIIRTIAVKGLIFLGILTSLIFSCLLLGTVYFPFLIVFLTAMAVWGIYYELLGFAQQEFVSHHTPVKLHSSAWGILSIFRNVAYFLGPLIGGFLLLQGKGFSILIALSFTLIGLAILLASDKEHQRAMKIDMAQVNLLSEIEHWLVLFKHTWPLILLSFYANALDATFWTVGAVYTEKLSRESIWGSLFLPLYVLPSLFVGFIVARLRIYRGKKKLAQILLFISCLPILGLAFAENIFLVLMIILAASLFSWASYPLIDAVYSNIVARMGRQRNHLIGLCASSSSLAYIIMPILAGFIAQTVGEKLTFVIVSLIGLIVTGFLLIVTPRKLRLPQQKIQTWK